jgi:hypothetical protein
VVSAISSVDFMKCTIKAGAMYSVLGSIDIYDITGEKWCQCEQNDIVFCIESILQYGQTKNIILHSRHGLLVVYTDPKGSVWEELFFRCINEDGSK